MKRSVLGLAALVLVAACAPSDSVDTDDNDFSSLRDLYEDGKKLDLGDLMSQSAGFATEQLNDALSLGDYGSIALGTTELYALAEDAQGDLTLQNLDTLVTGLAARFGERELSTRVNELRRDHLRSTSDDVYAESSFRVGAGIHDLGFSAGGFGSASVRLGFDAGAQLEARVVRAHRREGTALVQAPLAAVREARGFVLPRSVDDLRALKPGETTALRGQGVLGLNLGVGVPILAADPGTLSYRIVFSAGLRTRLEGSLDVQVVRLEGDTLLVDVGVDKASVREAKVAVSDGWGVVGLVEKSVTLAGKVVDLGKLADNAFAKQLNQKLSLVDASLEATKRTSRLSVARVRFDLSKATPGSAVEQAIAQALRADLRLAQALDNRAEPGVELEFELSRSGVASTSYAGIDLFGMSFFRKEAAAEGSIVVETPGGAQTILFDSLHRESGWFFSSHGYTRVGLSGLLFDPERPGEAEGEANLFVQIVEGDEYMERDKLLDHLDGVIAKIAGPEALAAIEASGNELERYVQSKCANQSSTSCGTALLSDAKVVQLRDQGLGALAAELDHLDPALRDLVRQVGQLRLTAQATFEPAAQLVGPPTSVVLDYRVDDTALSGLFEAPAAELADEAVAHLVAAGIRRHEDATKTASRASTIERDAQGLRSKLEGAFAKRAEEYAIVRKLEKASLDEHPELGQLGPRAVAVELPLKNGQPDYAAAALRSLPGRRAQIATKLFDELVELSKSSGEYPEEVTAYALLALVRSPSLDVRVQVQMDLDDSFSQNFTHYRAAGYASVDLYGRGADYSPIDGGMFSIDELTKVGQ